MLSVISFFRNDHRKCLVVQWRVYNVGEEFRGEWRVGGKDDNYGDGRKKNRGEGLKLHG